MTQFISGSAFEVLCALIQSRSFHTIIDPINNSQFVVKSEGNQTRHRWIRVFPEVHFQNGTNWYSWKRSAEYTCVNIQAY